MKTMCKLGLDCKSGIGICKCIHSVERKENTTKLVEKKCKFGSRCTKGENCKYSHAI